MKITETPIPGVLILEPEPVFDGRGFFARTWDRADLEARALTADLSQISVAFNTVAGTLRGLHVQAAPHAEAKTIRCTAGAIFDVAVDLRVSSLTFGKWFGIELSADNKKQLYIPVGFAHGFATLSEFAEVQYKQTGYYTPSAEGTLAWNDPDIGIEWPFTDPILSKRDQKGVSLKRYLQSPAFK